MIPIVLQGHERAITQLKYNAQSDLLFTSAKNSSACVWYTINGERLGTFDGHTGAIWRIDVDYSSEKFLSASTDCSVKLWDVCTGKEIGSIQGNSPFRSCGFSYCGNLFFWVTDSVMGQSCELIVVDTRVPEHMKGNSQIMRKACEDSAKITHAVWGPLDKTIICGYDNGALSSVDSTTGKELIKKHPHKGLITDIQMYYDETMFITASKDHCAKLFDSYDLECHRTYVNERPVNSASISSTQSHVILGGGQEAKDVTTTAVSSGKFDARLYHMIFEVEIGKIKGHFGPVNSVQFSPDGKGFASGGEDGLVRCHVFDEDYYQLDSKLF